jgi:SAM-dependent methyltransferase
MRDRPRRIFPILRQVKDGASSIRDLVRLPGVMTDLAAQLALVFKRIDLMDQKVDESIRSIGQHVKDIDNSLHQGQNSLLRELSEVETQVAANLDAFSRGQAALKTQLLSELRSDLDQLTKKLLKMETLRIETKFETDIGQLKQTEPALESFLNIIATRLGRLNVLDELQKDWQTLFGRLGDSLSSRLNVVENIQFESKNLLSHINTSKDARFNEVDNVQLESKNLLHHLNTSLHSRLNTIEHDRLAELHDENHELIALLFELRASLKSLRGSWVPHSFERYTRAQAKPFQAYLDHAERDFPRMFPFWKERLGAMLEAFLETKTGNAAHAGDTYSRLFRSFVESYAQGRVLDIGCGIFGKPYYLSSYPNDLISGLDPLTPTEAPDFEFVQGLSEYLPWPDNAFSTVISATSLDHCISLNQSLAEVERLLRPGGRFLLWLGSNPGSAKYEPECSDFSPADRFHLFHFDISWFEPMLVERFDLIDRITLQKTDYSHVMYCLDKKGRDVPKARKAQRKSQGHA